MNAIDEFMSKVEKKVLDGCWMWTGGMTSRGYGTFTFDRARMSAHRFSYMIFVDAHIPVGHSICHKCDNPGCVNPAHLFAASQRENMLDADRKKRTIRRYNSISYQDLPTQVAELLDRTSADAKTLPGWRTLGWSSKIWTRVIKALIESGAVFTRPSLGTFISPRYGNAGNLLAAIKNGELEVKA